MKFYQKRGFALVVLVLAILGSCVYGISKKAADLPEAATDDERQDAELSAVDLELFENVAYIMARQYDETVPATPDEWLDGFATFSIYEILPQILELWGVNQATTAQAKKK